MAVGATALLASGAFWFLTSHDGIRILVPTYRAMRVIDGDTFETEERQLIRLTGVNAPEMANCDGPEAKAALEKMILGKNLYVKVIYRDSSNRLISHVYNDQGLVSTQIARLGFAYNMGTANDDPELDKAANLARVEKIGIYSPKCTQSENQTKPKCVIKGNVRDFDQQQKVYHFPGCGQYNHTLLELYKGDRWFCSEKEAQAEGFVKGSDCFEKAWKASF